MDKTDIRRDIERLRRSARVTRVLAWVVIAICGLLALALVPGMLVAVRLREWLVLGLGLVGLVLLVSVVGITVVLLNRQRQILQAGETLLHLRDEAQKDPPTGL